MKIKLIIGLGLLAVIAGGLWWQHHTALVQSDEASQSAVTTAKSRGARPAIKTSAAQKARQLLQARMQAEAKALPPQKTSQAVRTITDVKADYQKRSSAIRSLSTKPGKSDLAGLHDFLKTRNPQDESQMGQVLKNELMDQLTMLDTPGATEVFSQIYDDHSQQIVIRDYALQHLIENFQLLLETGNGQVSSGELDQIKQALWAAVKETDSSIAGTALLGLSRLSDTVLQADREQIIAIAGKYAGDVTMNELTRVTALQICARMGDTAALPMLLEAAKTGGTWPVRVSAIGALGAFGGTEVKSFLTGIINGDQPSLKPAAWQALRQIRLSERQTHRTS